MSFLLKNRASNGLKDKPVCSSGKISITHLEALTLDKTS